MMRLLNVQTLQLESFLNDIIPPYAILSHTWGKPHDEVQYRDLQDGNTSAHISRSAKLRGALQRAADEGLRYIWVDTCCINKTSDAELSEAINSMFKWYQWSDTCYTYLADVTLESDDGTAQIESKLALSRWFTRGWTLQELLAPKKVHFYDSTWTFLGSKGDFCQVIELTTGIPNEILLGFRHIADASVAQRMSWAARRETKRKEDMAYCLYGIFDMPLGANYGEGIEKAFLKLQKKIHKTINDDSIFAWGLPTGPLSASSISGGLFASSPSAFVGCSNIVSWNTSTPRSLSGLHPITGHLRLSLSVHTSLEGDMYGLIACGRLGNRQRAVGFPLARSMQPSGRYYRPRGRFAGLFPLEGASGPETLTISIHDEKKPTDTLRSHYGCMIEPPADGDYILHEVYPNHRWHKETAKNLVDPATGDDGTGSEAWTFARLRREDQPIDPSCDFVVVLKPLDISELPNQPPNLECSIFRCDKITSLADIAFAFPGFRDKIEGCDAASDGVNIMVVSRMLTPKGRIFNVKLASTRASTRTTKRGFCATRALNLAKLQDLAREYLAATENVHRRSIGWQAERMATDEARLGIVASISNLEAQLRHLEIKKEAIELKLQKERSFLTTLDKKIDISTVHYGKLKDEHSSERASFVAKMGQVVSLAAWAKQLQQLKIDSLIECSLAYLGYTEVLDLFEGKRQTKNEITQDGRRPLSFAAEAGHVEFVKRLLTRPDQDVHWADSHGRTATWYAAICGHTEVVRALALSQTDSSGINQLTKADKTGCTPLHMAAGQGFRDTVESLLEPHGNKCPAYMQLKGGPHKMTALTFASYAGHVDVVTSLLFAEQRADVHLDHADENQWTPLAWAIRLGRTEVVNLILSIAEDRSDLIGADAIIAAALWQAQDGKFVEVVQIVMQHFPRFSWVLPGYSTSENGPTEHSSTIGFLFPNMPSGGVRQRLSLLPHRWKGLLKATDPS
jgi:ankyrin repeat protein